MSTTDTGNWLNQFVAPQLLREFKNYNDNFLSAIGSVPKQALSADGVRFNKLINNVGFYVDNDADFTPKKMTGTKTLVEWEKYDTDPTEVDDAEIRYLAYDKRNIVRTKHTEAFQMGIRAHALWKLAPDDDTDSNMPVMRTTGANDGTGRLRMTFANLVEYLELVNGLNIPDKDKLNMVLCPKHQTDLFLDRDSAAYFADKQIFMNYKTGEVKSVMGFKFWNNNEATAYSAAGAKLAKGAALAAGDQYASTFFHGGNTVKHIEKVKLLYKPETLDTTSKDPKSTFRTQSYGLIDRIQDIATGAIVSGNA